jgi:hypothetical protein
MEKGALCNTSFTFSCSFRTLQPAIHHKTKAKVVHEFSVVVVVSVGKKTRGGKAAKIPTYVQIHHNSST